MMDTANGSEAIMATDAGGEGGESGRSAAGREKRVYVGNLSYEVKGDNLKEFMRDGA